jgi:hemoglobin
MAYQNSWLAGTFALLAMGAATNTFARAPAVPPPALASTDSLYVRLGGTAAVTAFVADTIDKVVADPAANRHMKDALAAQICALAGGGCVQNGELMREMQAAYRISDAEFSGLMEAMRESMRARNVPLAARNQLLEILAPMQRKFVKL